MINRTKAKWGLFLITTLWATAPTLIKISLSEVQEFNLIAIRFLGAFCLLALLFRRQFAASNRDLVIRAFGLSIVLFLVFITMTFGVRLTTASKAGFLTCLPVIFVPIFALFFFKRKPERRLLIGIGIAVIGIGLLTLKSDFSINAGDVLCLLCSLFYGLYIILLESFTATSEPIALSIIQMGLVGTYAMFMSYTTEQPHLPHQMITWLSILILTVFCTAVAFVIQTIAQKHAPSEDAAIINTLEPLLSVAFAFSILHEILNIQEISGAALLLAGVLVAQINPSNMKLEVHDVKNRNH